MSPYLLNDDELWFPEARDMRSELVAVGGDLKPERLLLAYSMGIFPWYNEPGQLLWWCPEERAVLFPEEIHVSRSMQKLIRQNNFRWTLDQCFDRVIDGCRTGERIGHTWILDEIVEAYTRLHQMGYCHSLEVWEGDELIGGIYGISLGHTFFGESMFSLRPNASKFGLIMLARFLHSMNWELIDCQVANPHTISFGARHITRTEFLDRLNHSLRHPTVQGNWGDPSLWSSVAKMPPQP